MKILRIAGKNLASLAEAFELDFTREPLAGAGLFAITGPTGSGKSTLIDALCLALFDRTPRLGERSTVLIGPADQEEALMLGQNDVRNLVRRGSAEAWAEVDYLGRDRQRYRARWSVRRVKSRESQRLREAELGLRNLDTEVELGGGKKQTLAAVVETLGLEFEEFRRSVLLAQGEFAAFLRASIDERAQLLEKMTRTSLYGALSRAAHERAREADRELRELESRHQSITVLGQAERTARAERLARLGEETERLEITKAGLEQAERWLAARGELAAALVRAEEELTAATQAEKAALPRRLALERLERAAPLAGLHRQADRAARSVAELESLISSLVDREQQGREDVSKAARLLTAATAERERAEAAHAGAQLALIKARELDARGEVAQKEAAQAERELHQASAELGRAELEHSKDEARAHELGRRIKDIEERLCELRPAQPLAQDWGRYQRDLSDIEAQTRKLMGLEGAARPPPELSPVRALAQAETVFRSANQTLAAAEQAEKRAREQLADLEQRDVVGRRANLQTRQQQLGDLQTLAGEIARHAEEASTFGQKTLDLQARARASRQTAETLASERIAIDARRAEAASMLTQLRAVQDLSERRTSLRPGAPCPLCGATEHPFAEQAPVTVGPIADLELRISTLDAESRSHGERSVVALAGAEVDEAESNRAAALAREAATLAAARTAEWEKARAGLGELAERIASPMESGAVLEELQAALWTEFDEVAAEEHALREAHEAREALLLCAEQARGHRDAQAALLGLERAIEEISPGFDAWPAFRAEIIADAHGFRTRCTEWVQALQALDSERAGLVLELKEVEQTLSILATKRGLWRDRKTTAQQAFDGRANDLSQIQHTRSEVLGGRPTAEVEQELEGARALAGEAWTNAHAAWQTAQAEHGRIAQELTHESARLGERQHQLRQLRQQIDHGLGELGLDPEEVERLWALGPAHAESERAAMRRVAEQLRDAQAVYEERRRRLGEHQESAPAVGELEVREKLSELRVRQAELGELTMALRTELRADDEAQQRRSDALVLLEAGRQCFEVLGELGELIGAHDGKKFRVYAQRITFDALVGAANVHLSELAPRYSLMQVPRHELELQIVDRELADEIRPIGSLSGGETFLVSLALALGLASLGSGSTVVETLFIDEGFGTLDPETLEKAVAVLQALQATGRTVGVVSHVPELAMSLPVSVRVCRRGSGSSTVVVERNALCG